MLRAAHIWCSVISWAFWHFFLKKESDKNEGMLPKKTNFEVGVWGGSGNLHFGKTWQFYSSKDHYWVFRYGFGVNKSIYTVKFMLQCFVPWNTADFVRYLAVIARNIMDAVYLSTWIKISSFKFIVQKIRTNWILSESLSPLSFLVFPI